jgi:hypothetical protein
LNFLYENKTEYLQSKIIYKDNPMYEVFAKYNIPLKQLNDEFNMNRAIECFQYKYGLYYLLNMIQESINIRTEYCNNAFKDLTENKLQIEGFIKVVNSIVRNFYTIFDVSFSEIKDISKNHFKFPSEKIKDLLKMFTENNNSTSNKNNDEIVAYDNDMESIINISPEDHIKLIEQTNKEIIKENNLDFKAINSVVTDTKTKLQYEFRHLVISNIATDVSKDVKFSDYIFYYVLFHIMEVPEFGPVVNKYGWVYSITRLGDDLIEMVDDSGDEFIDSQLSKLGIDITSLKGQYNINKIAKMKQYNKNINVESFNKNLQYQKVRIKKMIWSRLCWIIDYIVYILLLKKTDIDNTNIDNNLHSFAHILEYSLNCRLHLFTLSGFHDIKLIEETNLETIVVKCYQKFSSRKDGFVNVDKLNSQMRTLINKNIFEEMKIILHVASKHSPIVDYKTDIRIKDLAYNVDDLKVLHSIVIY